MRRLVIFLLLAVQAPAQISPEALALLQKVQPVSERLHNWRATLIRASYFAGAQVNVGDLIRTDFVSQTGKGMRRVNTGGDRTTTVCDGAHTFYSANGNSFEVTGAGPDCSLPLTAAYDSLTEILNPHGTMFSLSIGGEGIVALTDHPYQCTEVQAEFTIGDVHTIRTLCIDRTRSHILADRRQTSSKSNDIKASDIVFMTSFEANPSLSKNASRFTMPPNAVIWDPPGINTPTQTQP